MSFYRKQKSSYQYGKERKDRIVDAIQKGTVMTTNQIRTLFFSNLKPESAKRKTQEIMRELVLEGRVKRYHNPDQQFLPAYYYINQKPRNLTHYLTVNEVLCEFVKQKHPLFKLQWDWSYSIYNGMVISDAKIDLSYDPDSKKRQVIMLEVEMNPKKRFDKDIQYQKIYDMNWHIDLPEWVIVEENKALFPTILIVTNKEIKIKENINVNFVIASMDEVKNNVYKLIWRK